MALSFNLKLWPVLKAKNRNLVDLLSFRRRLIKTELYKGEQHLKGRSSPSSLTFFVLLLKRFSFHPYQGGFLLGAI